MKKYLIPVVIGVVGGCLVAVLLFWLEFYNAEEVFTNYRPEK